MKKCFGILSVLFFLALPVKAQQYNIKHLIGKWESADGGGIEAIDTAKIFLVYEGQKKPVTSVKADFSKSPCWFDFVVSDGSESYEVKSLLRFLSNDLLQWQVFDDGERPEYFTSGRGEIVYLKRVK